MQQIKIIFIVTSFVGICVKKNIKFCISTCALWFEYFLILTLLFLLVQIDSFFTRLKMTC